MNANEDFEQAWPQLDRRLRRLLAKKSIPFSLRDDVVQETGLRLFRMWADIDPTRGAWPLAVTIANNLVFDLTVKRSRKETLGDIPETAAPDNVESAGMARLELGAIARALTKMNHNYRAVLLADVGYTLPLEGKPRALNMLRMRARKRLAALTDGPPSFGIAVPLAIKDSVDRALAWLRRNHSVTEGAAAAIAILIGTATLTFPRASAANPPGSLSQHLVVTTAHIERQSNTGQITPIPTGLLADVGNKLGNRTQVVKEEAEAAIEKLSDTGIETTGPVKVRFTHELDEGEGTESEPPDCSVDRAKLGAGASCRTKVVGMEGSVQAEVTVDAKR